MLPAIVVAPLRKNGDGDEKNEMDALMLTYSEELKATDLQFVQELGQGQIEPSGVDLKLLTSLKLHAPSPARRLLYTLAISSLLQSQGSLRWLLLRIRRYYCNSSSTLGHLQRLAIIS